MKKFLLSLAAVALLTGAVSAQCAANFTWSQPSNNVIAFTNTSTPITSFTNFQWTFGDSQFGYTTNPTHTYANPGSYYVCLFMYDSINNCQSSFCDTIVVTGTAQPCAASFMFTQSASNTISFTNTSTPSTAGYTFSWSFGDSQTSAAVSPTHTYTASGTYTVCLTMFNSSNCQSTYCDTITVTGNNPPPCQASFTWQSTSGTTVAFTNTSLPSTSGYSFVWAFGNSQTSTSVSPTYTYPTSGTYVVCLVMFDSTCQSSFCDTISLLSSIAEYTTANWSLYPNPATDQVTIRSADAVNGLNYRILDVAGREVVVGVVSSSQVDVQALAAGAYFLQLQQHSGTYTTQRFQKQ